MTSPPFFDALKTKEVSTSELSIIISVVSEANYTFSNGDLSVVLHFCHSASDPRLYLVLLVPKTKVRFGRNRESE